ncbi:PHB/PHA accumulation regulator DNA-binding domain-containing protein [Desulfocicer vacuolatum DSM 3385]|uniref:PHB/PHA accumulation regulator DNA-binding domain-containing protein n=1 Tax=Desulfocicer vacuolatum DSM 3385 TaxID=1121400 RepID=A0A1W2DTJ6_9BACT|nr:polyhydroxyalkanoate synthesis regulator DNA-binding domain-containing protein [Desulfocicer vacuolatum]SMD00378.1 PHB/PHA accumulation regulator DNA-binding domain-containing protein [Desulfocicer vacuolatum DSM 3385]
MLKIKKYSNGKYFDTEVKEYIKSETLAAMVNNGEKIQVVLARTGKDITEQVIEQLSGKEERKKEGGGAPTDKVMKWVGEIIDSKIDKVMDIIKLPTREQVAGLEATIKELNDKIDALSQEKTIKESFASPEGQEKSVTEKTVDAKKVQANEKIPDNKLMADKKVGIKTV